MEECTSSATAIAKKINNSPDNTIKAHITESVETLLDPLREAWGHYCCTKGLCNPAIRVSSGYRCPKLNAVVGGATNSAHCSGYAFDLVPLNGKMIAFKHFCRDFLADKTFDQLISESENAQGVPSWMHVGYKHPNGQLQRKQYLSMIKGKYYPMTN